MYIIQAVNKYSTPYFNFCRFWCVLHVYTTTLFSCNSQLSPRIVVNTCLCPWEWHWLLVVICSFYVMFQTFRVDTECQQHHELLISSRTCASICTHVPASCCVHAFAKSAVVQGSASSTIISYDRSLLASVNQPAFGIRIVVHGKIFSLWHLPSHCFPTLQQSLPSPMSDQ